MCIRPYRTFNIGISVCTKGFAAIAVKRTVEKIAALKATIEELKKK